MTIKKIKRGFRLVSHTGRNLGTYKTLQAAKKREQQITHFKNVRK